MFKCNEHRVLPRRARLHSPQTIPPDNYQAFPSAVTSAHRNFPQPDNTISCVPVRQHLWDFFHAETRNVTVQLHSHAALAQIQIWSTCTLNGNFHYMLLFFFKFMSNQREILFPYCFNNMLYEHFYIIYLKYFFLMIRTSTSVIFSKNYFHENFHSLVMLRLQN